MMEFLNKLKRKPEHVRKRIAIFATLGIFFVIVNIWWVSWTTPVHEGSTSIAEVVSPLGVVADMVLGMKDGVDNIAVGLKDQLQYATGTPPSAQVASVRSAGNDVVYPEEIFEDREQKEPPVQ